MYQQVKESLGATLEEIRESGLWKSERTIASPQSARIVLAEGGREVINMCANNYLGLSDNEDIVKAASEAMQQWGYGLSSVRFICGKQEIHEQLEVEVSQFLGMEDTILFAACFDANGAVFEPLLTADDAIVSDALNHASIIDGIRLCKAKRYRYANNDLDALEEQLKQARADVGSGRIMIATDGVFSMNGTIAHLGGICDLAEKYEALVMVDDCHATGFMGQTGRGTHEFRDCIDRVDILTGTFGKALGGASGGYVSGRKEIIELLRQRARPYLFSNSLAPAICGGSLKALQILSASTERRDRLWSNTAYFRRRLTEEGFSIPGMDEPHPIVPIMLGDAKVAQAASAKLLDNGVYAIGFFYPVVAQGAARIRTQVSAGHSEADLEEAVQAFVKVRAEVGW
ncbi:MAG: glycine C-acetyltransferase [Verrucomicrobiales bacterium]|nr:glycine C-acetyltransferase [Verrucomicrobiales bacterium]